MRITVPAGKVVPCDKKAMIFGILKMRSLFQVSFWKTTGRLGIGVILNTTILQHPSVLQSPDMQTLWITNQLPRSKHRTNGASTIETLTITPLALSELCGTATNVIGSCVSEYVIQSLGFGNVFAGFDNGEDDFLGGVMERDVLGVGRSVGGGEISARKTGCWFF